jgi:hypothetical protein
VTAPRDLELRRRPPSFWDLPIDVLKGNSQELEERYGARPSSAWPSGSPAAVLPQNPDHPKVTRSSVDRASAGLTPSRYPASMEIPVEARFACDLIIEIEEAGFAITR